MFGIVWYIYAATHVVKYNRTFMENEKDRLSILKYRLEILEKKHAAYGKEIAELREAVGSAMRQEPCGSQQNVHVSSVATGTPNCVGVEANADLSYEDSSTKQRATSSFPRVRINIERFIGENLISKIGIAILIIGVAIGVKYAFDYPLISPVVRVVLGYLIGVALTGLAFWLKKKYAGFSAVLHSGAMAIMYFITFTACSFYGIFSQEVAFCLMVFFTIFTVLSAISYNLQVVALIGMVGAYAVPFLLSDGSGNPAVMFGYMAIINAGILFLAFKRSWRLLNYASFLLTWIIYGIWLGFGYQYDRHFMLGFTFASIFFVIFYFTFLAYRFIQNDRFDVWSVSLLLANSFLFYGFGYALLDSSNRGELYLGAFTLVNAAIHFVVGAILYFRKLADRSLFYLVMGLVLVFITIAIPVQLSGSWVTLLWAGEAALLFGIGRRLKVGYYELLSYVLMVMSFLSLIFDWQVYFYETEAAMATKHFAPLLNVGFLSSSVYVALFGFIGYVAFKNRSALLQDRYSQLVKLMGWGIAAIFILAAYYSVRLEIALYWQQEFNIRMAYLMKLPVHLHATQFGTDCVDFRIVYISLYSMLFLSLISIANIRWAKNPAFARLNLGVSLAALLIFLIHALLHISNLRDSYQAQQVVFAGSAPLMNLGIRYVAFLFVLLLLVVSYYTIRKVLIKEEFYGIFTIIAHVTTLWIGSSELIHWLDILNFSNEYRFGLSILWGLYALLLIVLGIWQKRKYLRVASMILLGVTLVKLFFYDLLLLDSLSKTLVLICLGVILLAVSFLYNKYKSVIFEDDGQS